MMPNNLTIERLKELFHYDPETGWFTNLHSRGRAKAGERAGSVIHCGYRRIIIDYEKHYEHRLAWLYVYGEWPDEIDHLDGHCDNNAITNLRSCNRSQNNWNAKRLTGQSGLRGAYLDERNLQWYSKIQIGGQQKFLGNFNSAEEAHQAFEAAARDSHGDFYYDPSSS
jgi:hypothetical protein